MVQDSIPDVAMRMLQENFSGRSCGQCFHKEHNDDDVATVNGRGVEEFLKAKHIKPTRQHQSGDDNHTELLSKMSSGERINSGDLKTYKLLQEGDSEFEFATILTSGNQVR